MGGALFTRVVTSRTLESFAKSFILEGSRNQLLSLPAPDVSSAIWRPREE